MTDDLDPDTLPEMPDELRDKLFPPRPDPKDSIALDVPPGKCPIHGNVGFNRFMLIVNGELLSDHCTRCLSRIFTALVGVLEMPEEPVQCTPEEIKKQGG